MSRSHFTTLRHTTEPQSGHRATEQSRRAVSVPLWSFRALCGVIGGFETSTKRRPAVVLSFVERGWQAAREQSLMLQQDGISVVHLIKGRVSSEVLALVRPSPTMRLVSVRPWWFWPWAFGWVLWARWRGVLQGVLVDNERTQQRVTSWLQQTHIPVTDVSCASH